ncbi:ferredoxin [Saccharopolyspora phatthalungensis]|uniref:Ferredoxin n=1 Tax=Saccharopolyspora phatthalungensis TaxID=664693 RepID=A0A840PXJ8_9PSEU|nr:ferredoxin [Saccharopolyspora phatthalungensis]MBB5153036.1 ferredoxin [Saccharopolyspora phatthalungensis]
MSWSIEVDADTCIGSGMCAGIAPDHFDLVDGYSCVKNATVDPAEQVVDAAESCPVEAILVKDADTGEIVAPAE